jgi:hypothetical protein
MWNWHFLRNNHNLLKSAKGTLKYTRSIQEIHLTKRRYKINKKKKKEKKKEIFKQKAIVRW